MRRLLSMVLLILLCSTLAMPAKATDGDVGSIEIRVEYENEKITGGDLIAVRVGYIDYEKQIFRKVTNHEEIKDIGKSSAVTQMQNFYSTNQNIHTFLTFKAEVKNGIAKFSDLPKGLYLIYQENAADGYEKLTAFLVTVPYNGKMHVTSASKPALERESEAETKATTPSSGSSGNKKLPQTGQLTWPIPWLTVTGMALFSFGWWLCFGKREEDL